MKLANSRLGLSVDLFENRICVLVIENKKVFSEVVYDIWKQCKGIEGDFVLSEGKVLKPDKVASIITNPFDIDFNSRRIINALYAEMNEMAEGYIEKKTEINKMFIDVLDKLILSSGYSGIEFNIDYSWTELFKVYGVKLEEEYDSLLEKLVEYIKLVSRLCGTRIVYLLNIKMFMSKDELRELYQNAYYNKVQLVLIEGYEQEKIDGEDIYIIDNDKCFIVK